MGKKKITKQSFFPYDWEEIERDNGYNRIFKALESKANIRPFGDITNTALGRLCQEYNEYQRQLKLKKRKK